MREICAYPHCHQPAHYFMGWNNENGKHFGLVCSSHDKVLGRANLINAGMSQHDAELFEVYCKYTSTLQNYPDWLEWLAQDSIELLDITMSTHTALRHHGITKIEELLALDNAGLLRIHRLGTTRVREIKEKLEEHLAGG